MGRIYDLQELQRLTLSALTGFMQEGPQARYGKRDTVNMLSKMLEEGLYRYGWFFAIISKIGIFKSRIEILVYSCSAKCGVSSKLLDVGLTPSSERAEIWERWGIIVVGVPKLLRCYCGTSVSTSHDSLPHVGSCVNSRHFTVGLNSVNQLTHECTVAVGIGRPSTSWAGVSFHINPHHPVKSSANTSHHLINLSWCTFSPAWEHIDISDETCSFGVIQSSHCVVIDPSIWAIPSYNNKAVSIAFHALIGGSWEQLRYIHSKHTVTRVQSQAKKNQNMKFVHIFRRINNCIISFLSVGFSISFLSSLIPQHNDPFGNEMNSAKKPTQILYVLC